MVTVWRKKRVSRSVFGDDAMHRRDCPHRGHGVHKQLGASAIQSRPPPGGDILLVRVVQLESHYAPLLSQYICSSQPGSFTVYKWASQSINWPACRPADVQFSQWVGFAGRPILRPNRKLCQSARQIGHRFLEPICQSPHQVGRRLLPADPADM